jgi:5-methylcytosine-specific restriction endonuclease McrA
MTGNQDAQIQAMWSEDSCMVCGDLITGKSKNTCVSPRCTGIWSIHLRVKERYHTWLKTCGWCEQTFADNDVRRRFCSRQCRSLATSYGTKDRMSFVLLLRKVKKQWRAKTAGSSCVVCNKWMQGSRRFKHCEDCIKEVSKQKALVSAQCVHCKKAFSFDAKCGRRPTMCSEDCKLLRKREIKRQYRQMHRRQRNHRQRAKFYGVPYESGISITKLLKSHGAKCQICGGKLIKEKYPDPMSTSVDHVIPLSAAGSPGHVISNVQLTHLQCNIAKGASIVESYQMVLL